MSKKPYWLNCSILLIKHFINFGILIQNALCFGAELKSGIKSLTFFNINWIHSMPDFRLSGINFDCDLTLKKNSIINI
jgi:orotate phosphoribosyltransferase